MARAVSTTRARTPRKSATVHILPKGKVKMIQWLEHNLKDIYWAEKKTASSISKLLKQVESEELSESLSKCQAVTTKNINILASLFKALDIKPKGKRCHGIEGLWHETDSTAIEFDQPMLDPAILECMKKIIQYNITAYTCLSAIAKSLDHLRPAKIMKDMVKEESDLLKKLEDTTELHIKRAYLWQVDFD